VHRWPRLAGGCDHLLYGYDIKFPFFDQRLLDVHDNEVQLFERVIHPR